MAFITNATGINDTRGQGIYAEMVPNSTIRMKDDIQLIEENDALQPMRSVVAAIYITVFIFGMTGNGIILYTLLKVTKNRTVTELYILSLAISDVLFVSTLPISATDMIMGNQWIFGGVVCTLFISVNYLALCAGVLIVTAMSVDRFQNVVFAIKMMGVRTTRRAKIIITSLWAFSVIYMIPASITASVIPNANGSEIMRCSLQYEDFNELLTAKRLATAHTVFRFLVAFLVPFIVMVVCNVTIIHFLRKRRQAKRKNAVHRENDNKAHSYKKEQDDRVTRLILIVTSVFLVCFLPNLILNTIWVLGPTSLNVIDIKRNEIMLILIWCSVCLLYINSALNPLLYAFSGSGFRESIKEALRGRSSLRNKHRQQAMADMSPMTRSVRVNTPQLPHTPFPASNERMSSVVVRKTNTNERHAVTTRICFDAEKDPPQERENGMLNRHNAEVDARDPLITEPPTFNDNDSGIIGCDAEL